MTLPRLERWLRQGRAPGTASKVRADLSGSCRRSRPRAWPARAPDLENARVKGVPTASWKLLANSAGRDGVTRTALVRQTKLDAARRLAQGSRDPHGRSRKGLAARIVAMDRGGPAGSPLIASNEFVLPAAATRDSSPGSAGPGPNSTSGGARSGSGRPAAANAARERSRVQTLRHAFLELQRTLPSVPPDTKLSKLDVLLLATTYIAHLTRSLQDDAEAPADPGLGALRGDGYLHPVKKWPMRSRLYIGATGQFLKHSVSGEKANHGSTPTDSQT
ncbi:transcription factor 24 isoform X2 [Saccopteryx bilineata]|uniref:transcription factor 24 isoform X2 n=1 Tax=Saccopteryx bilineata TaxID=59482 RepID=UPI00338F65D1